MRSLIRFGLANAVLMNLVFVAVVVFAATWAIPRLPVDRFPNFSFGEVGITVRWPGASAADVERLVVKELEDAIRGMDDLEFVRSTAIAGQAEINVKFIDDTDYERLYDELRLRILGAQNRLPAANGKPLAPVLAKVETDQWLPVLQVSVLSADPQRSLGRRQLTLLAKELQTRIEGLPEVKRVDLWGDQAEQFVVGLDPGHLSAHGVAPSEVVDALTRAGLSEPGGTLPGSAGERLVRIDQRYRDADQIMDVVVRLDGEGRPLRVGDLVAQAASGIRSFDGGARISLDGLDAVACKVIKTAEGDARRVKTAIQAELKRFAAAHPEGGFRTSIALDSTTAIDDSVGVLAGNLLQGFALILVILTVFLGFRQSLLTLNGMIFAFLGALLYFQLAGESINELSLLGFVIVVGILVDDAVVVLDNIARHREEGKPLDEALVEGTSEVFWPIVASVATTMASFLPLLLMTGIVGEFFALIPTAVVAALALSLFEALLILPAHVRDLDRLLGPPRMQTTRPAEDAALGHLRDPGLVGGIARVYDAAFRWCLARPLATVGLTFLLFIAAIGVLVQSAAAPFIGQPPLLRLEFFPSDAAMAEVRVTMPGGTSLEQTDTQIRTIAAYCAAKGPQQVSSAQGIAGLTIATDYKPLWGSRHGIVQVELAGAATRSFDDPNAWIRELATDLKGRFEKDGVRVAVTAQQGGPPTGNAINVRIAALDDAAARNAARALLAWMNSASATSGALRGAIDLGSDAERLDAVLDVRLDRDRLAQHGLAESEAARFAATLVEGAYAGDLRRSDDDIPVRVRISRPALGDLQAVDDVPLRVLPDGQAIRLSDVGRLALSEQPSELVRRDFIRTITITGNLAPDSPINAFQATAIIRAWFEARASQHPGVVLAFGGEAESTGKSYESLILAFAISILAIYTILAVQFGSYTQPLLIMSSIIFSITGVVLVMGAFGVVVILSNGLVRSERALFTVNSFIAIVALTGMVVNNAIILIDFINQRRRSEPDLLKVLRESAHLRLRAVLLTTITTIFGFLPTAIGIPTFNPTWSPLAMALVSGLAMSTVLTLLVVPVLYLLHERMQRVITVAGLVIVGAGALGVSVLLIQRLLG